MSAAAAPKYRALPLGGSLAANFDKRPDGTTLVTSTEPLAKAVDIMAERDIGSLVVMDHGDLTGMLTFREVIQAVVKNGGAVGSLLVRTAMDDHPLTCTSETELDEAWADEAPLRAALPAPAGGDGG